MKNTNKPQWLLDAEKDINEVHETNYGKLTDKEFKLKERQSNAGKSGGTSLSLSGKNNATHEGRLKAMSKMTKEQRSNGGKKNVETGHLANVRNPSKAGLAASKSENSINKQKYKCPPTKEYPEGRIISRNWLKRYCDANNINIDECIRVS